MEKIVGLISTLCWCFGEADYWEEIVAESDVGGGVKSCSLDREPSMSRKDSNEDLN